MFDLRIPVYRDHFREPENYHPWVNGLSYAGYKEWNKSMLAVRSKSHDAGEVVGKWATSHETVVDLDQLYQSFYHKDFVIQQNNEGWQGYNGPSTCFKDYEHGSPFLYFLMWHPTVTDSFVYLNGSKGYDYFTKYINLHDDLIGKV